MFFSLYMIFTFTKGRAWCLRVFLQCEYVCEYEPPLNIPVFI